MALIVKDRVQETTTTTGTGTLTLAGAVTGFQTFSTAIGNTNTTYYAISSNSSSEFEVGIGTVGAGTLARTTILASSNGGTVVNLSAGTKFVFCTQPAGKSLFTDANGNANLTGQITATGGWAGSASAAGKLGGIVQSFHVERSNIGSIGGVMAYGNGNTNMKGLRMPFAGKLILAALSGITITGTITLNAYLNGVQNSSYQLTATATAADVGVTQDFQSSPLSFSAGDTLGWYQAAVPTIANGYNVNYYVIYD